MAELVNHSLLVWSWDHPGMTSAGAALAEASVYWSWETDCKYAQWRSPSYLHRGVVSRPSDSCNARDVRSAMGAPRVMLVVTVRLTTLCSPSCLVLKMIRMWCPAGNPPIVSIIACGEALSLNEHEICIRVVRYYRAGGSRVWVSHLPKSPTTGRVGGVL